MKEPYVFAIWPLFQTTLILKLKIQSVVLTIQELEPFSLTQTHFGGLNII